MAAGDIAARNSSSGLDELTKILQTIKGGAKTTSTSSEVVSNEKATALLKQILEGSGGLAAVSGAQKGAGLYNSTGNSLLTNDLLARSTANVAALSSQKTQTTQVGAQPGALGSAISLAGSSLLKPTITAGLKKLGVDTSAIKSPGDYIADAIFGNTSAATSFSSLGADAGVSIGAPVSNTAALQSLDFLGGGTGVSSNIASSASGVLGSESLGSLFAVDAGTAGLSTAAASSLTDLGFLSGIGGGAAAGSAAGLTAGTLATDVGGSLSSLGFLDGIGGAAAAGEAGAAGAGALGALGPIGLGLGAAAVAGKVLGIKEVDQVFNGVGDAVTGLVKGVGKATGWIICTELNKQGRLPNKWYYYGAKEFAKYDERGKQGYYIWAVPAVQHLRKYPTSLCSKVLEITFNARAEYLSAKAGLKGARKTMFGAITTHGLYAICWILSRTIARKPVEFMHIVNNAATK